VKKHSLVNRIKRAIIGTTAKLQARHLGTTANKIVTSSFWPNSRRKAHPQAWPAS